MASIASMEVHSQTSRHKMVWQVTISVAFIAIPMVLCGLGHGMEEFLAMTENHSSISQPEMVWWIIV
jgi:hypothetical protein